MQTNNQIPTSVYSEGFRPILNLIVGTAKVLSELNNA